jgi:hypothetical protein
VSIDAYIPSPTNTTSHFSPLSPLSSLHLSTPHTLDPNLPTKPPLQIFQNRLHNATHHRGAPRTRLTNPRGPRPGSASSCLVLPVGEVGLSRPGRDMIPILGFHRRVMQIRFRSTLHEVSTPCCFYTEKSQKWCSADEH